MKTILNSDGVPLYYVIRTARDFEGTTVGVHKRIATTPLEGTNYDRDNFRVYQLINGFMPTGAGHTHI